MNKEKQEKLDLLVKQIHMHGYSSICFWLPTRSVGGGTFLFCELCNYILDHTDLNVYYLDCPDGYAHDLLQHNDRVKMIDYHLEDDAFPVKEPLLVFTNTTRVIQIKNMNPNSKLIFWHWETNPVGWDSLFLLNETDRFLRSIVQHNALLFHDWSSFNMLQRQTTVKIGSPNYFPVFLPPIDSSTEIKSIINENEINIAWVGRLSHDKVNSVNNIITCFARYKTTKIKRFHIIGDGLCANQVYDYAKKYYDQMEFIFTGTIPHHELKEYLVENVDVLFAMGTAVLDGASIGLPSVVVTLSEKPYFDDAFYLLPETKDYCVGITISQKQDFNISYTKFSTLLDRIVSGAKVSIGKKCRDFFVKNYNSYYDRTMSLLTCFMRSSFTLRQIKKILKFIPYNQLQVKSLRYKNKNIISIARSKGIKHIILFNQLKVGRFRNKKIENTYVKQKKHGFSVVVKNGYVFSAEKFKG